MSSPDDPKGPAARFPRRALARFAEILLRRIHQHGGRDRFVPVATLEEALGMERDLVLHLCRTELFAEVLVADRPREDLECAAEYRDPVERLLIRYLCAEPHVRVRPPAARLTENELLKLRARKGRRPHRAKGGRGK